MIFKTVNRLEALVLFLGDLVIFYLSLWITLLVREGTVPYAVDFVRYLSPFTILFGVWLLSFFIAGLYEKHTTILRKRLPAIILNTQIINTILGIFFFYFIPYFGITPKTILFIYLVISFCLVVLWRRYGALFFSERTQEPAILIGSGEEMHELLREVNGNPRYGIHFAISIDPKDVDALDFQKEVLEPLYSENITTIVIDTKHEKIASILPSLYNLIFSGVRFFDMYKVYEDVFDRIPLSLVQYSWFLENISITRKVAYEFLKRVMDIVIALPLSLITLLAMPFVWGAIAWDDGGKMFIVQERVGRNNKLIRIIKIRTMRFDSKDEQLLSDTKNYVTKTGEFLRKSRMDELPQLWNVLLGDLSLIGPRPELPQLVKHYETEVPFYNVRHLIKPGLSGWAQIYHDGHPHHGTNVEETRTKLSYDLYYIKNRSFFLDLKISLKTLKTLLSRMGA